jgi:ABC-2 type transport system ATP-binding protein
MPTITEAAPAVEEAPGPLDTDAAVSVRGLAKSYGDLEAVRGVDFDVRRGETYGFLGPNGAGKSTTINMLCTLVTPSAGRALVAGHDVVADRFEVRRSIGLVFQETTLDFYLTVEENLRFHADLYGVPKAQRSKRIADVLEITGLSDRGRAIARELSGGMKRRLEIARGLLHAPRVLFLDEPTVGLDPQSRLSIWEYLTDLRRREEITIFLTTHYLEEAEYCDRIAIMDAGRIAVVDTPEALKAHEGEDRVRIVTADEGAAIVALRERFGVEPQVHAGEITFHVAGGESFVPRLFAGLGVEILSVSVTRPTLDDVFLAWTGRTMGDAEADQ